MRLILLKENPDLSEPSFENVELEIEHLRSITVFSGNRTFRVLYFWWTVFSVNCTKLEKTFWNIQFLYSQKPGELQELYKNKMLHNLYATQMITYGGYIEYTIIIIQK